MLEFPHEKDSAFPWYDTIELYHSLLLCPPHANRLASHGENFLPSALSRPHVPTTGDDGGYADGVSLASLYLLAPRGEKRYRRAIHQGTSMLHLCYGIINNLTMSHCQTAWLELS